MKMRRKQDKSEKAAAYDLKESLEITDDGEEPNSE